MGIETDSDRNLASVEKKLAGVKLGNASLRQFHDNVDDSILEPKKDISEALKEML